VRACIEQADVSMGRMDLACWYAPRLGLLLLMAAGAAAPGRTATAEADEVAIQNFMFTPASLTVQPGAAVTWTQQDRVVHTVTSGTPGAADAGTVFDRTLSGAGAATTYTFSTPGTFAYFCRFHPIMRGIIQVGEPLPADAIAASPDRHVPRLRPGPDGAPYVAEGEEPQ
jgi:plastocyanin